MRCRAYWQEVQEHSNSDHRARTQPKSKLSQQFAPGETWSTAGTKKPEHGRDISC